MKGHEPLIIIVATLLCAFLMSATFFLMTIHRPLLEALLYAKHYFESGIDYHVAETNDVESGEEWKKNNDEQTND